MTEIRGRMTSGCKGCTVKPEVVFRTDPSLEGADEDQYGLQGKEERTLEESWTAGAGKDRGSD